METSWRHWCRLCAQEGGTTSIFANNNDLNMPDLIKDILHFEIHPTDKAPVTICRTCVQFISSVFKFTQHVSKVQSMYSSMICDHLNTSGSNIKSQFGLVKEEPPEWCINDYDPPINALKPHIEVSVGVYENQVEKKEEIEEIYLPQTDPLHVSANCETRDDYDLNLNASTSSAVQKVPETISVENRTDALSSDTDEDEAKPLKSPVRKMEVDSTKPTGKRKYKKRAPAKKEVPPKLSADNETDTFSKDCIDSEDKSLNSPIKKTEAQSPTSTAKRKYKKQDPPFPCDLCDQIFMVRKKLWGHRRRKHFAKNKIFSCKQCDKVFDSTYKLKRHAIVHSESKEKHTYPCPICDKKFITKHYVQIHLRTIHEGQRPFVCEKCGQSFPTKSTLLGHGLSHLEDEPHKCDTCGKAFKCPRALKTHEEIHSDTTYPCPICGLQLGRKRTLQRHMLLHSDVKRYECKLCNSKFKQSKTLKVHLLTHSGLQPYACQFCDRTFANGSNCRSHKKKVHPVELAMMEASGEVAQPTRLPKLKQLIEENVHR